MHGDSQGEIIKPSKKDNQKMMNLIEVFIDRMSAFEDEINLFGQVVILTMLMLP